MRKVYEKAVAEIKKFTVESIMASAVPGQGEVSDADHGMFGSIGNELDNYKI